MRKSFRTAAFSWLRSLFKQSARKDHDPGVDGAALPASAPRPSPTQMIRALSMSMRRWRADRESCD